MSFPQHPTTRSQAGYSEGFHSSFSTSPPSYPPRDHDSPSNFESNSGQPSKRSAPIPVPHAVSQSIGPELSPKIGSPLQSYAASSSYHFYNSSRPIAPESYGFPRCGPTQQHSRETSHGARLSPGFGDVVLRQQGSSSADHTHQNHYFRYSPPLRQSKREQDERTSCPYCLKVLWVRGLQVHIEVCERAREAQQPRTLSGQSRANPDISQGRAGRDRGRKRFPQRSGAVDLTSAQPRHQTCAVPTLNTRQRVKPPSPKYLRHLP